MYVAGWALGSRARAIGVEFTTDDALLWRAPLGAPRPDLAEAFPDHPEAGEAGFRTTVNLGRAAGGFELSVRAVLEDGGRPPIGTIRGR